MDPAQQERGSANKLLGRWVSKIWYRQLLSIATCGFMGNQSGHDT